MSRPVLLVCVLLILIITSQFEWRQQLVSDVDAIATPRESQKQQRIQQREESIKEKIILSQEKNIQSLNELVRSLKEQLRQCRGNNETSNGAFSS
ncbi:uncharacterized protein LOC131021897 [Salvia miltiorrhiza]|uniref:uncharacterized protein LOC131021897 n=1 Tax=Salvia miltiorrhiza TaxID=226208 RepID=UPI0025AC01F4|nr:uncharacterized protein LOC131021897 [Salvia miltiorrhiza]XP_057807216.1 uncharacterized protein LOC131021897 [Salvia miltiorrhiza]